MELIILLKMIQKILDEERALILGFLILSLYGFMGSFQFFYPTDQFPRLASGIVVILCLVMLAKNYLPESLQVLVEKEEGMLEDEKSEIEQEEDEPKTPQPNAISQGSLVRILPSRIQDKMWFTLIMFVLYIVASFFVGILWVTPIFVCVYIVGVGRPWYVGVALAILMFGIGFLFMEMLNLSLDEGRVVIMSAELMGKIRW